MNDSTYSAGDRPYLNVFDAQRFVLAALVTRHGPSAATSTPAVPVTDPQVRDLGQQRATDPVAALRASRDLYAAARRLLTEHARAARGAGRSWEELGAALNLPGDDYGVGFAAFDYIAMPADPFTTRSVRWRCETCGQRVNDREPWNHNPDDNEYGHAPDCTRHNNEVTAYLEQEWAVGDDTDPGPCDSSR
jgi:hypothetical protein